MQENMRRRVWMRLKRAAVLILGIAFAFVPVQTALSQEAQDSSGMGQTEEIEATISVKLSRDYSDMQPYIEGFMKKYPGITVEYECVTDYENAMKEKVASGDYGDVLYIPSFFTSSDCAQYLTSMGNYISFSKKYNFMSSSRYANQTVYGVPSSAYLAGIIYNKEVFDKAGITQLPGTIEEFIQALELIKERTDAVPLYTNYNSSWALQCWEWFPYIEMTGSTDYKENIFPFEKDPFLKGSSHYEVYDLLYYIVSNGLCEEAPAESDWETSKRMLNDGSAACIVIGSWAIDQVKKAGDNPDNIGFMPFPNTINGIQYVTVLTDYCYGISRSCENKEAAKLFVSYMLDESGYALDHDAISIVKTDPFPDVYGDMGNVTTMVNNVSEGSNYSKKLKLSADLDFENDREIERIIEAGLGLSTESFDDIAADWNERWEANRSEDIEATVSNTDWRNVYGSEGDSAEDGTAGIKGVISREYNISFSNTEQTYIEENPVLKVGYLRSAPPYQYEKDGAFAGVSEDVLEIIAENTGFELEYYAYDNTEMLLAALDSGEITAAAGIRNRAVYTDRVKFSRGYIDCMDAIVKSDTFDINQISEKKAVLMSGEDYSYVKLSADGVPLTVSADIVRNTVADCIRSVEKMEADYTVADYYSANYFIKREDYKHVAVVPINAGSSICFAFSKEVDTRLVSILNKCIYSIPDNEIQIMLMNHTDIPVAGITLRRFVEANKVQSMVVITGIAAVVAAALIMVFRERYRSARKHKIDAKRYQILAALSDEYVFEYDYSGNVLHMDKKFVGKFTFDGDISLDEYANDNEDLNRIIAQFPRAGSNGELPVELIEMTMADGSREWYRMAAYVVDDDKGRHEHIIGKLVYAQNEVEEKRYIQNKAVTDPLTGLYNRDGFVKGFTALQKQAAADGADAEPLSVTFAVMDIDNFKYINDTLGHAGGDEALKALACQLRLSFSDYAVTARYGGDEFILCMYGRSVDKAKEELGKFVAAMCRSFEYQGASAPLSISLGAVYTVAECSYEQLFKSADAALYEVKRSGKNAYNMSVM